MDQIPAKSVAQSRGLIRLVKTKQELEAIDTTLLSEAVLVDTKSTDYNVRAIFQASQQRSLCELSQDGNSLFITSLEVTEELFAKYGELYDPDASVWDVPTLRRLDLTAGKLHSVPEADCVHGVLSISSSRGLLAVNNYRTAILITAHGRSVQMPEQRPVHHICVCHIEDNESKQLVISSLGAGASSITIDNPLSDSIPEPRLFSRGKLYTHFSTGKYDNKLFIFGAANNQCGASVFQINEKTLDIGAEQNMLSYGEANITASMGSCQTEGPLFAMGTLDGRCFIWNVGTRELVQVMYNLIDLLKRHNKIEIEAHRFANNSVLNVKFNPAPKLKHILVFAEASNYVHIVDTRTFKEQILPIGKGNPIAGLCFSPDGTKLYVATLHGVKVYSFYMRASLLEHCSVYIMENLSKIGWNISDLPADLHRRLRLNSE
jgi:WD40 repeat protein